MENGLSIAYRLGRVMIGDEITINISSTKRMHLCSVPPHSIPLTSNGTCICIASSSNGIPLYSKFTITDLYNIIV